jgi:hypothetical protein
MGGLSSARFSSLVTYSSRVRYIMAQPSGPVQSFIAKVLRAPKVYYREVSLIS